MLRERESKHTNMQVCAPRPGGDKTKFSSPTVTIKCCSKLKRKIKEEQHVHAIWTMEIHNKRIS